MAGIGGIGGGIGTAPIGGIISTGAAAIFKAVDLVNNHLLKPILLRGLVR